MNSINGINPEWDSTFALMLALQKKHSIEYIYPGTLFLKDKKNVILIGKNSNLYDKYNFEHVELIENNMIEVYHIDDLKKYKTETKLKEQGKIRQEGKNYLVQDGDIIFFKFNV